MPLSRLSYRQVERRLRAAGFQPVTVHGSHVTYCEIAVGTLRSIVRQAGMTVAQFEALGR